MALVVTQQVPTSSSMSVPHGPVGVGAARRRLRAELRACGADDAVIDDAVLVLSELLSNAYRHARPLDGGELVRAGWSRDSDGAVTISVTDGGGPTRPLPASPSVTAKGGRGLTIIRALARDWGVSETAPSGASPDGSEEPGSVTVWAVLAADTP
ncbi:ATP-binding protein [Streptomyces sp. 7-21]|uniref:ATP-binding protein n=1 Tax=Streptomyces sp. 7-21 TaxID=2802283 RepID=UPI00191CDE31|nr:ATP-binding protein [Streptomyces sp. 7-21]MBL1067948.1 ATP-binding protein [Streptomyces sp. 7-21]